MKQTKIQSAIEAVAQTAIGLLTSIILQLILYQIMEISVTLSQNFILTVVFTAFSLIRGYVVRRIFAKL